MPTDRLAIEILRADKAAADARLRAALVEASPEERGCSAEGCPGPSVNNGGGCPMGYAGSCRRSR